MLGSVLKSKLLGVVGEDLFKGQMPVPSPSQHYINHLRLIITRSLTRSVKIVPPGR